VWPQVSQHLVVDPPEGWIRCVAGFFDSLTEQRQVFHEGKAFAAWQIGELIDGAVVQK